MLETELYAPVKALFEEMGASVRAEVGDCDVYAVMPNGETIAAELKLHLNLDVIVQAVQRQNVADKVYIAVPGPKKSGLRKWHNIGTVLRRLEIGLITVKEDGARVTFPPKEYDRAAAKSRNRKKREKLDEEFSLRHGDLNTGGTNGKTVTVYRERCVLIASLAKKYKKIALCDIADISGYPKAKDAVMRNYYGWFENDGNDFRLSKKGKKDIEEYKELASELLREAEG